MVMAVTGEDQTFTFIPDTGHEITEVKVDGDTDSAAAALGRHTFYQVVDPHTLEVSFSRLSFTLTAEASNDSFGIVTVEPDSEMYYFGDTVIISALANRGYGFDGWSGDISDSSSTDTVIVDRDYVITAEFVLLNTYTVTVTSSNDSLGSVFKEPDSSFHYQGDTVMVWAQADSGALFLNWLDQDSTQYTDDTLQVVVSGDVSYTAVFESEVQ
jgi:hypothetical protein